MPRRATRGAQRKRWKISARGAVRVGSYGTVKKCTIESNDWAGDVNEGRSADADTFRSAMKS